MGIEKRRHRRLDIAIEVHVRGTDQNGHFFEESTISGNISLSGCAVLISRELATGTELELEFRRHVTGQQEPVSLPMRGAVMHVTPLNKKQFTLGIEFREGQFPMDAVER